MPSTSAIGSPTARIGRRAREAARFLPAPVRTATRRVYRALAPAPLPTGDAVRLPSDVADADALREVLSDTDIFGAATQEAEDYLNDAFERFRITMALVPDLEPGARVLELGANPYFLTTLLLRRGLDVTCANYFGDEAPFGRKGQQVVTGPRSGERRVFEFEHFNVERERFPYDDNSFDLVLCCEILEHLPNDPTHLLAEIHRVLRKPHGALLLTTPNAVRLDNLLRMERGDNVYEELSGHGTYGRHNREYTVAELRLLLTEIGYEVDRVFAADIHDPPPTGPLAADVAVTDRGDNLFAVARAVGEARWRYPRWLYAAKWNYRRVVRADLVVGINEDVQGAGFHETEVLGGRQMCWTGAGAVSTAIVTPPAGRGRLVIEGFAPPPEVGGITVRADVGEHRFSWNLPCEGQEFRLEEDLGDLSLDGSLPSDDDGAVRVELSTNPVWRPRDVGHGRDARTLGVAVSRVALEAVEE